jgi:tetratricopeptide (TPR) repeat protein
MVDRLTANLAGTFLPQSERPQKAPEIEQASTSNVEAYKHYQQGLDLENRFFLTDAVKELSQAIALDPQFALAMVRLADTYGLEGDLRSSREWAEKANQFKDRLPRYEALALKMQMSYRSGDLPGVLDSHRAVVSEFPRDTAARGELARDVMVFEGKADEALGIIKDGLAQFPKDENLLNFHAYIQEEMGDLNGALAADDLYQQVRPGDPNPVDTRGDVLFFAGRDDDAAAAYRKAMELGFREHQKLAIVLADQNKLEMAKTELEKFAAQATPLERLYVPVFEAQFAQRRGDVEGAIADYREAVKRLGVAKQSEAAGAMLMRASMLSVFLGDSTSALSFASQQKLEGEELVSVAYLQRIAGNDSAADEALRRHASSAPWISQWSNQQTLLTQQTLAAIQRGDGASAVTLIGQLANQNVPLTHFIRARAQLLASNYAEAEAQFRATIFWDRDLENFPIEVRGTPTLPILSHFYLGQVYEKTGKRDQALNEYQEFLSHFESSHTKLPQVAEAKTALKNLMK